MKTKLKLLLTIVLLTGNWKLETESSFAQPTKQWDKRFGGNIGEYLTSLQQTADGGYILGGYTPSLISGDITEAGRGSYDYWIVKTDANGTKQWDKRFGGSSSDVLSSLQQTTDGGYILGGTSVSGISGDRTETKRGFSDYWIVKTDANGNKQWDKRFGGDEDNNFHSLRQTADGGYILSGYSNSFVYGDKTSAGMGIWLVKIDANGNKQWDKIFGFGTGSDYNSFYPVQQTSDGGYIVGTTADDTWGLRGYWLVKTNANGTKLWDKYFGGSGEDILYSFQQTTDGGYILGGSSNSPANGNKTVSPWSVGYSDYWIVKTDANGTKLWDKRFGGIVSNDILYSLQQTTDGGYILGGRSTAGISGDKTEANQGVEDYWIVKTDANGTKQWDKRFGTVISDLFYSLQQTSDGEYILGGASSAGINGDKTEDCRGSYDYWIVKTGPVCSVIANAGNDTTICKGDTITLMASGGISYVWQTGNPEDTLSTLTVSPTTTTIYTVNVTDSCSVSATVTVTVDSVSANISGTTNLCKTGNTILTASGGASYLWSTGDTIASITVNPTADSLYSVTVSNASCSDTSSVTVTRFIATIAGTDEICTGDSTILTASALGATSYSWNNGDTAATIKVGPLSDSLYQVILSGGICSDTISMTITVSPPPTASITGTTTLCSGTSTSLTASGGTSYLWNTSDTLSTINVNPQVDTIYFVTVFIGSCSDTESVNITVKPSPVITTSNVKITAGESITITANATGNSTYTWTSSPDLNCETCQNPVANPAATTTYYVTATGDNGCASTDSVIVTLFDSVTVTSTLPCEVSVPNAFSPNGDEKNDLLKVHGDCIKEIAFSIYDRWGEEVFKATDLSSAMTKGWDGTYKEKTMNTAVFVYYLTATLSDGTAFTKKGNISLIR